jgi:hypothetical protein
MWQIAEIRKCWLVGECSFLSTRSETSINQMQTDVGVIFFRRAIQTPIKQIEDIEAHSEE